MFTHDVDAGLVHFQWPVRLKIKHWIFSEDFLLKNSVIQCVHF